VRSTSTRRNSIRPDSRASQHAVNQPGQAIRLIEHAADDVAKGIRVMGALQRHFAHAADRGQRRSQLMGSLAVKFPKAFEGSLPEARSR
jgi:hypothetical protein